MPDNDDKWLPITDDVALPLAEIEIMAVRAQGPGGQNVNKVSSAIHLRFDIVASSLPDALKQRLLARNDQRLTKDGVIVLKAQASRSQEQNRAAALQRLQQLLQAASVVRPMRRPTRPTLGAQRKRLESKLRRGQDKRLRSKVIGGV